MHHQGISQRQISEDMRVSLGYVNKIVQFYENFNSSLAAPRKPPARSTITEDVAEYIESEKLCKPSMYTSELQQRLLFDGISPPDNVPSQLAQANTDYTDYFLDQVGQRDFTKLHFFDESSVLVTTGNRKYGNSYLGEPAVEFQRYASNANYTLNLLHSAQGVDYFDILRGPSNGMELLNFFNEALLVDRVDGSTILENGDVVIMDNCGFHHGHFVEPMLRDILREHGVDLLFQPAYSHHLNTCELCFIQIKCYLQQNTTLTTNETEIAIGEGLSRITAANSIAYFRECGYI